MLVQEIGSEFWDVPICEKQNDLFAESTQWFLSGRSALQAIIKGLKDCRTVAMPSWCCDSMVNPFIDVGIEVHFYPVYLRDRLIQEIIFDCDALFLMDYFGYTSFIPELKGYKGIVIRDVTHSIFSTSYDDADYYFGSLRKWCGVWTGGYAWTRDGHELTVESSDDLGYIHFREKAMKLKNSYINGFGVVDKEYLRIFDAAEECLEKVGIVPVADRDIELAKKIDVDFIKSRRRSNAEKLRCAFHEWLIFPDIKDNDCPMFVPVLVPNGRRNELRQYLISKDIYCPIHWPVSKYHILNERERFIYDNELSLVCDQRYTEEDMNRVVNEIEVFFGG